MDETYVNNRKQEEKQKEDRYIVVDQSLTLQKKELQEWTKNVENQENYRMTSRRLMESINKAFTDKCKGLYGITQVEPTMTKDAVKQTIPVAKSWWWSRLFEESALKKARKKYGSQISVNSIREQRAMKEYEELRDAQKNGYHDEKYPYTQEANIKVDETALKAGNLTLNVNIKGYDQIVNDQQLNFEPDHYSRTDEIEKGLTAFFGRAVSRYYRGNRMPDITR